jgi:hypothetical protein
LYSLNSLSGVIASSIQTLSDQITSTLDNSDLASFTSLLSNNDFDNPFLQSNITSINGNTSVEMVYVLKNLQNEVTNLKNVYKSINYSDNISDADTISLDSTTLTYLLSIENTDAQQTINYPIIISDTQTNSLLLGYTKSLNDFSSTLLSLPTDTVATIEYGSDIQNVISSMYNTSVTANSSALTELNKCDTNYVNNNMCSVYANRKSFISALPYSYDGSFMDNPQQVCDDNLSEACSDIVDNNSKSIVNLSKAVIHSVSVKQQYLDAATKKSTIRNNYLNSYSAEVV